MSKIITGSQLRDDLLNLKITRVPIIPELFYERDVFMLTADSGSGKSIFATQLAACLSFGRPFLGLEVPQPKKVLYIQLEGDYEESVERMRYMESEGGIVLDEKNILWVEEKTLDVSDSGSVGGFLKRIYETGFIPEVVITDPIYKASTLDISTGQGALGVVRFSDLIYNKWNCSHLMINHNTKDSYDSKGKKIDKDDHYYGHSFLKNHIRTGYTMKITGENSRDFVRIKGRGSDTRKKFSLDYNPETFCLSLAESTQAHKRGQHQERFYSFLETCKKARKQTTASEIIDECEITYQQLRTLKSRPETTTLFTLKKIGKNNVELWFPNLD